MRLSDEELEALADLVDGELEAVLERDWDYLRDTENGK